jgi:hypothetical protein
MRKKNRPYTHIGMDDFQPSNLYQSRDELCARLVGILTPLIIEGIKSIFNEAVKMCVDNQEVDKYLMHFQNLISHIPKWNGNTIETERKRIIERSGCNYLEELITCVHIIHLKVLTCVRVGNKQKKIDISIPKLDNFLHKAYINVARKTYMNVYLFERGGSITPLQIQKNNREFEIIVQECILSTIRESIPTEEIIRAYTDESMEIEEEVIVENIVDPEEPETKKEEHVDKTKNSTADATIPVDLAKKLEEEVPPEVVPAISNVDNEPVMTKLSFNDYDSILDTATGKVDEIEAPKTIERLEEISTSRAIQRKLEEEDDDEEEERIKIHTDAVDLDALDIFDFDKGVTKGSEEVLLDGIEEL